VGKVWLTQRRKDAKGETGNTVYHEGHEGNEGIKPKLRLSLTKKQRHKEKQNLPFFAPRFRRVNLRAIKLTRMNSFEYPISNTQFPTGEGLE